MMSHWLSFAGRTAKAEEWGKLYRFVAPPKTKLGYYATVSAQKDTLDLGLIAIKTVLAVDNGLTKDYSVEKPNMDVVQVTLGSLAMVSAMTECIKDANLIMAEETANRMEQLFIPNAKVATSMSLAASVGLINLTVLLLASMATLTFLVPKSLSSGILEVWIALQTKIMTLDSATQSARQASMESDLFAGHIHLAVGSVVVWVPLKVQRFVAKLFLTKLLVLEISH
jgi:hypothetical protein